MRGGRQWQRQACGPRESDTQIISTVSKEGKEGDASSGLGRCWTL